MRKLLLFFGLLLTFSATIAQSKSVKTINDFFNKVENLNESPVVTADNIIIVKEAGKVIQAVNWKDVESFEVKLLDNGNYSLTFKSDLVKEYSSTSSEPGMSYNGKNYGKSGASTALSIEVPSTLWTRHRDSFSKALLDITGWQKLR